MLITDSDPTFSHCRIADNLAGRDGGGQMYDMDSFPSLHNCVISDNRAWGRGGGAYLFFTFNFALGNCTVSGNRAAGQGGAFYISSASEQVHFDNSIIWHNSPDAIHTEGDEPTVRYCNVQGGWPGPGNIAADPVFVSRFGIDLLLAPASPCVDQGDPALVDGICDAHPRWPRGYVNGERSDMGATGGPQNRQWWWTLPW